MTTHPFLLCSAIAMTTFACAADIRVQGSGTPAHDERLVATFDRVKLAGSLPVRVSVGAQALTLDGDDNLLPLIVTEVQGATLVVHSPGYSLVPAQPLTIAITANKLVGVSVIGSGQLRAAGIDTTDLDVDLDGSGSVSLEGKAEAAKLDVNGDGHISARDLVTQRASASVFGSGSIELCAQASLGAKVQGSGRITYFCSPASVSRDVWGSGKVAAGD